MTAKENVGFRYLLLFGIFVIIAVFLLANYRSSTYYQIPEPAVLILNSNSSREDYVEHGVLADNATNLDQNEHNGSTVLAVQTTTLPTALERFKNYETLIENSILVSAAARKLPKKGQLFCWVQTTKMHHESRAKAVNETWLHRCDHGQFFTENFFNDSQTPYSTVFAGFPQSYGNLYYKSRYAFYYIYQHISKNFDWYLKADDDTYVIVEHLREYIATLDSSKPYYLGYVLRPFLKNGYNSGGAGYVLSRAALEIFAEELYHNETLCPDDIFEDSGIGRCLSNAEIYPHDTRTAWGQNRFNAYTPAQVFHGSMISNTYTFYDERKLYDALTPEAISFHHIGPDDIRLFDILLYRMNTDSLHKMFNGTYDDRTFRKMLMLYWKDKFIISAYVLPIISVLFVIVAVLIYSHCTTRVLATLKVNNDYQTI